jgi:hypothetical protein
VESPAHAWKNLSHEKTNECAHGDVARIPAGTDAARDVHRTEPDAARPRAWGGSDASGMVAGVTPARLVEVAEYYRDPEVRARLLEYCGASGPATSPTAAYAVGFDPTDRPLATWAHMPPVPSRDFVALLARGCDVSRALWDARALLFLLELDYLNVDYPGEPFAHPTDVFFKLEPAYTATIRVMNRFGIDPLDIGTGRGYQFVGQIPLADSAVDGLASLVDLPAWYDTLETRRPAGIATPLDARCARAAGGLGLQLEYLAHLILLEAHTASVLSVVVNGTPVGAGPVGRECVSIDISHAGDPLDVRHVRAAFGTYQWHCARPDIFGEDVASGPPLVALPRARVSLEHFLRSGRDLAAGRRAARSMSATLPDLARGIGRLIAAYRGSALARFHATFAAERRAGAGCSRRLPGDLPPCLVRALQQPNDLLLKPEFLQDLTRGLLAREWRAADIAACVQREYDTDHDWGDRWMRLDSRTRSDFDVRVFAGLVATGVDQLTDFNCTSSQEKGICPRVGCPHDLRDDRAWLAARFAS